MTPRHGLIVLSVLALAAAAHAQAVNARAGADATIVTYGACCRIALDAAGKLSKAGIEAEVVDAQSLLPFDIHGKIVESLKKTNRILFLDEDVPGGTSAYMLQEVIAKKL